MFCNSIELQSVVVLIYETIAGSVVKSWVLLGHSSEVFERMQDAKLTYTVIQLTIQEDQLGMSKVQNSFPPNSG